MRPGRALLLMGVATLPLLHGRRFHVDYSRTHSLFHPVSVLFSLNHEIQRFHVEGSMVVERPLALLLPCRLMDEVDRG